MFDTYCTLLLVLVAVTVLYEGIFSQLLFNLVLSTSAQREVVMKLFSENRILSKEM